MNTLNLPTSEFCCGCLLKKWEDIPGRDDSPKRSNDLEIKTAETTVHSSEKSSEMSESHPSRYQSCVSPDLFDTSDCVLEYPGMDQNEANTNVESKQSFKKIVYQSDSGIEHFESVVECQNDKITKEYSTYEILVKENSQESNHSRSVYNSGDTIIIDNEDCDNGKFKSLLSSFYNC